MVGRPLDPMKPAYEASKKSGLFENLLLSFDFLCNILVMFELDHDGPVFRTFLRVQIALSESSIRCYYTPLAAIGRDVFNYENSNMHKYSILRTCK